jgi:TPR repeat protein
LLALCNEFGYEPLRADCAKILQPKANPNPPSHFLEERISRQEMELATVHSEIGHMRQSISEVRELFERRGGLIAQPSAQGTSSAIESRFASLEKEVSVLRQRLESEQLYRQGQEYLFGDHQYEKSALLGLICLERSASLGHSDAAYCYGTEFSRGGNCPRDVSISVKYFKQSANQGNSFGENAYGLAWRNGEGVSQNLVDAAKYFKLSADQGNASGQNSYGVALKNGEGVSRSLVEAAKYYKLSADQGNASGQVNYGAALRDGIGVSQNVVEAAKYFKLSADQGNALGQQS